MGDTNFQQKFFFCWNRKNQKAKAFRNIHFLQLSLGVLLTISFKGGFKMKNVFSKKVLGCAKYGVLKFLAPPQKIGQNSGRKIWLITHHGVIAYLIFGNFFFFGWNTDQKPWGSLMTSRRTSAEVVRSLESIQGGKYG